MIKAVIFDWGGVIAPNQNGGWLNVLARVLNTTIERLLPHWRAAGYSDFSKGIIDEATFWQRFEASFSQPLPKDITKIWVEGGALHPWPEMLSFLEELKAKNIHVALLSNLVEPVSVIAYQSKLFEFFNPVVISNEVGLIKPDPVIYQIILDELQVLAAECIFVDDLSKNLDPANNMGMITIQASNNPSRTISDIKHVLELQTGS